MSEQSIYYDTLHRARMKGMSESDARKAAYIASKQGRPRTPRRRRK